MTSISILNLPVGYEVFKKCFFPCEWHVYNSEHFHPKADRDFKILDKTRIYWFSKCIPDTKLKNKGTILARIILFIIIYALIQFSSTMIYSTIGNNKLKWNQLIACLNSRCKCFFPLFIEILKVTFAGKRRRYI